MSRAQPRLRVSGEPSPLLLLGGIAAGAVVIVLITSGGDDDENGGPCPPRRGLRLLRLLPLCAPMMTTASFLSQPMSTMAIYGAAARN